MFSVPRIYEKVYNKVLAGVQSGSRLKKQLFAYAMAVGRAVSRRKQQGKWVPPHLSLSFQAAEMLVFGKLKRTFGGKIRFFISGGAPLAREIAEFFHAAGMLILEGYGLTETTAASNLNAPRAFRFGTVGKPLPGVEMRIADDGEILLRGDNIFAGYYRREDATAEVMQDGWFCTGDIGTIDADGLLRITDRKKDLIVTSGGKNIAPQNIENLLKTDPIISQVMVYGDKRNYLTALVTLDPDEAASYAEHKEIAWEHMSELSRHPQIRDRVDRAIQKKNVPSPLTGPLPLPAVTPRLAALGGALGWWGILGRGRRTVARCRVYASWSGRACGSEAVWEDVWREAGWSLSSRRAAQREVLRLLHALIGRPGALRTRFDHASRNSTIARQRSVWRRMALAGAQVLSEEACGAWVLRRGVCGAWVLR